MKGGAVRRRAVIGLGLAAASAAALSACSNFVPEGATGPGMLTRAGIVSEVNAVRAANGRKALAYSSSLEQAARAQAQAMASKDTLSHTIDGPLRQRVNRVGYRGALGENVASGQKTLEQALEGWLNSPSHRSTMLSPKFSEFGLSAATAKSGRIYWAVIFGGDANLWIKSGV